jgi:hypothetical protein
VCIRISHGLSARRSLAWGRPGPERLRVRAAEVSSARPVPDAGLRGSVFATGKRSARPGASSTAPQLTDRNQRGSDPERPALEAGPSGPSSDGPGGGAVGHPNPESLGHVRHTVLAAEERRRVAARDRAARASRRFAVRIAEDSGLPASRASRRRSPERLRTHFVDCCSPASARQDCYDQRTRRRRFRRGRRFEVRRLENRGRRLAWPRVSLAIGRSGVQQP